MTKYIQEYPLAKYWETIGEGGEVTQSHLAKGLARTKGNESCGCSMTVFIELLKMVRAERGGGLRPMKENMSSWRRAGDLLIITLVGQVLTLMATAAALGGLASGQPPAWPSSAYAGGQKSLLPLLF